MAFRSFSSCLTRCPVLEDVHGENREMTQLTNGFATAPWGGADWGLVIGVICG